MAGFGKNLPVKGYVKVWKEGELIREGSNRVVQGGLECLAQRVLGEDIELPSIFSFGTSSASTLDSMTDLQGTKLFSEETSITRDGRSLKWAWDGNYSQDESVTVGEIGIFNEAGLMLARFVPIPAFTVAKGASLKISWEIKMGG